MNIYIYIYTFILIYISMRIDIIYIYIHIYIPVCICIYTFFATCTSILIYIYIYISTHLFFYSIARRIPPGQCGHGVSKWVQTYDKVEPKSIEHLFKMYQPLSPHRFAIFDFW